MSGYLKVQFEGVGTQKLIDLLTNEEWEVVGAPYAGLLIVYSDVSLCKKLHDAIWKHNGGMWCYIEPISEDDADQYL